MKASDLFDMKESFNMTQKNELSNSKSTVEGVVKPKYRLCWLCNRQFRGNHFAARNIDGHERHVHKTCAEEHDMELSC